jgi:hypothetical protein
MSKRCGNINDSKFQAENKIHRESGDTSLGKRAVSYTNYSYNKFVSVKADAQTRPSPGQQ